MSARSSVLAQALRGVLPLASRVATSPSAEVRTVTRAGVTTVTVVDGDRSPLTVTLDTRPAAPPVPSTQLLMFDEGGAPVRHEKPAEAPAPQLDPVRVRGLARGDRITLDDEPAQVLNVDGGGFKWCSTIDGPDGEPRDGGEVYWSEVEQTAPGRWIVRPVKMTQEERKAARRNTKPAKAAPSERSPRAPKSPKPAALPAEPEADALARKGLRTIVWQQTAASPWEVVTTSRAPEAKAWDALWQSATEGHRARDYDRGRKCVRESRGGEA